MKKRQQPSKIWGKWFKPTPQKYPNGQNVHKGFQYKYSPRKCKSELRWDTTIHSVLDWQ